MQKENGLPENFEVTNNHPFYVLDTGWVDSGNLKQGMKLTSYKNNVFEVKSLTPLDRSPVTYNFEVADFHTFFVGKSEVWVHNQGSCDCSITPLPKFPSVGGLYDDLLAKGSIKTEINILRSHVNPDGSLKGTYNDGRLGEELMKETLERITGKKFVPIQNDSGHGPDGVFIDESTTPATIYIAEAKSSVNGESAARAPEGTPQERLDKWIKDFDGPRYANVDAATRAQIESLKTAYRA